MTLEEKIKLISTTKCNKEGCSFLNQKLSDAEIDLLQNETYKFAIEFGNWIGKNTISYNNDEFRMKTLTPIFLTSEQLLEQFKKEKEL